MKIKKLNNIISYIFIIIIISTSLHSVALKDISNILGVRDNQLLGYGIVVGLNGSGDSTGKSPFTKQALANMLLGLNIKISANDIKSKNIAAVLVTAKLPAFVRQGDKIDVLVSSIGDAKSLRGGVLIVTPLKGLNGEIYAIAQGALSISKDVKANVKAYIPNGATVEKKVVNNVFHSKNLTLTLKHSSFINARNIQNSINDFFNNKIAKAIDSRTISLLIPKKYSSVEFIASLQEINVDYKRNEKIVIDEGTGTIIAGLNIEVKPVLVTYLDIVVQIEPTFVLTPSKNNIDDSVSVDKDRNIIQTKGTPTVAGIARALQKMGASPKEIIAIFTAMKKAGAIIVDIEVM